MIIDNMSNVSDNTSLLEFYTSISTLQTDAQLKVNALFENLKQEAIATLHKKLFNLSIQSNPLKTPEISTPEAEIVISKPELSHAENTIKKKTKEKAEAEPINVSMLPVKRRNKNRGKDTEIEYLDVFHQKAIKHKAMILKMYSSGINPKVISKLFTISVNSIHLLGN